MASLFVRQGKFWPLCCAFMKLEEVGKAAWRTLSPFDTLLSLKKCVAKVVCGVSLGHFVVMYMQWRLAIHYPDRDLLQSYIYEVSEGEKQLLRRSYAEETADYEQKDSAVHTTI